VATATTTRPSRRKADAVLDPAVDLARAAAEETAEIPAHVGEHVGTVTLEDRLVEHRFAAAMAGYQGWVWSVVLARVPRGRTATVCEVALLPADGAILAPPWLPWAERIRPGDVGPGDVLPFVADDPRLAPGWEPSGDPEVDEVAIDELALARTRILSADGVAEAAQRWYDGASGPRSASAQAASDACLTCGYLVPLQGALGQLFGVCTNPWSPDDGRVVAFDHGCGAHSETDVPAHPSDWPAPHPVVDEVSIEVVEVERPAPPADDAPAEPAEAAAAPAAGDEPAAADEPAADAAADA